MRKVYIPNMHSTPCSELIIKACHELYIRGINNFIHWNDISVKVDILGVPHDVLIDYPNNQIVFTESKKEDENECYHAHKAN